MYAYYIIEGIHLDTIKYFIKKLNKCNSSFNYLLDNLNGLFRTFNSSNTCHSKVLKNL